MAKIIKETETSPFDDLLVDKEAAGNSEALISHTLRLLAAKKHIQGILSAIYLTPLAERFNLSRPEVPFFLAAASEGEVCRLNLRWGVCPFLLKKLSGRKFVKKSLTILLGRHLIKPRQKLALVLGQKSGLEILEI
jgi:pyruvate kinase